ncbi:MAG: hypothetical protein HPY85_01895 [Anaerolineae bacterium]|nr:hypothetical protein [Anaerolineae bacterium]
MRQRHRKTYNRILTLFIIVIGVITACRPGPVSEPVDLPSPAAEIATETPTPQPTETPPPGLVVLVAPQSVSAEEVNLWQSRLASLVETQGLVLDVRDMVTEGDISQEWKVVLFLDNPERYEAIRASAPDVQFVRIVNDPQLNGDGNGSVIYDSSLEQSFMAGYVTMLAAPDFRAGGLLSMGDGVNIDQHQQAFINGAAYFCGRCASVYMPVTLFPVTTQLPGSSAPAAWLEAYNTMNLQYIVYTTYVDAGAGSDELYTGLTTQNTVIVGGRSPGDTALYRWAATVQVTPFAALESIWPALMNGQGGHSIKAPVEVADVSDDFLSQGRMRLVDETLQALMDGAILPLSPDYP